MQWARFTFLQHHSRMRLTHKPQCNNKLTLPPENRPRVCALSSDYATVQNETNFVFHDNAKWIWKKSVDLLNPRNHSPIAVMMTSIFFLKTWKQIKFAISHRSFMILNKIVSYNLEQSSLCSNSTFFPKRRSWWCQLIHLPPASGVLRSGFTADVLTLRQLRLRQSLHRQTN